MNRISYSLGGMLSIGDEAILDCFEAEGYVPPMSEVRQWQLLRDHGSMAAADHIRNCATQRRLRPSPAQCP